MIEKAHRLARTWHAGQLRKYTKASYYEEHLVEVAGILEEAGEPEHVVAAGLLHDVLEDTPVTFSQLAGEVGAQVAKLVQEVTDVSKPEDGNRAFRKALDRDHLAKASPEGQTVKLADLISNTASITKHDPHFSKVYLAEKRDLLKVLTKGNADLHKQATAMLRDNCK